MKLSTITLLLAVTGIAVAFQQPAAKPQEPAAKPASATTDDAQVIAQQVPSYPLTTCPISKESLDSMGKPFDMVHEGRLVRLCCKSCVKEFKKDPAPTLKAIDEAVVKAQQATYPLKTCVVSGEQLGSAGTPIDFVNGTRLVRFCCKDCVKGFQKEPAKFMAMIDAALIAEQKKTYPLQTCLVSGKPIQGEGVSQLYGTRLTRFCCDKCPAAFAKEPAKYLAQLDQASAKKN
jgi:YHS domain-containing protein